MDRQVHAHFRVIRINRWSLALVLLAVLALLLLPSRRHSPVNGTGAAVVKPGVTLMGRDFSGKTEAEARAMLQELAESYQAGAVAARELQTAEGISYVIPELNGYTLDVDQAWLQLISAEPNTQVAPATRVHTPNRKLTDYPQAVIRQGNPDKRAVTLMINIDVGWGNELLTGMLKTLDKHGAKATFFVSGRWAKQFPDKLKEIARQGHEVATHGYDLSRGPTDLARAGQLEADIKKSVAVIQEITGSPVQYYSPHRAEADPDVVKTAGNLKLRTVLYSLDTRDWMPETTASYIVQQFQNAKAGDLILMHLKPNTAQALEPGLMDLRAAGYSAVILTELLKPQRETPPVTGTRK